MHVIFDVALTVHLKLWRPQGTEAMATAVGEAMRDGDITPADVEVAEVHDCFTIAELMMYEAAGFAEQGQGAELLLSGRTTLEDTAWRLG